MAAGAAGPRPVGGVAAGGATVGPPAARGVHGFLLHLALGLWGLSSWILFNGLWGQLPLFVRTLPEGNRVGVLILTAEQLAYVFPLFFMFKKKCIPNTRRSQEVDIWVLLLSGLAVSLLLGRWWDYTAPLGNIPHSVGLMALAFATGAVCSSTGVVFTPYLASCPKTYTSAHTAGAGLSGLAVALLALAADSGAAQPRLPIDRYFAVLSGVFACSIVSFAYVSRAVRGGATAASAGGYGGYEPLGSGSGSKGAEAGGYPAAAAAAAEKQGSSSSYGAVDDRRDGSRRGAGAVAAVVPGEEEGEEEDRRHDVEGGGRRHRGLVRVISPAPITQPLNKGSGSSSGSGSGSSGSPVWQHWPVFALQFLLSALAYGIVPSVLPLACAGYGGNGNADASGDANAAGGNAGNDAASRVLMLATVGFMCADPLGKLATSFLPTGRVFLSGGVTVALAAFLLLCAHQSAHPPFAGRPWGGALPVAANTLFSLCFSFTSVSVFFNRRRQDEALGARGNPEEAYQWFAWSAFIIQTGAVCGTLGMAALAAAGLM